MIGIDIHAPTGSAIHLPAATITAAVLHTGNNSVVLTYTNASGASQNVTIGAPEATDLYNALVAIKAGSYSTTT